MVLRPRTKAKKANKQKRCPKCGALVGNKGKLVRCKRCAKSLA